MLVRVTITFLLYGSIIGCAYPKLHMNSRKEQVVFIIILCCSFYCSLSFILNADWPNVDELINILFSRQLKWIVDALTTS